MQVLGNEHPIIPVRKMPQQERASNPEEDWTGVVDRQERKKLQNRLNQRVYRQRKMNRLLLRTSAYGISQPVLEPQLSSRCEAAPAVLIPASAKNAMVYDFPGLRGPASLCDFDSETIESLMANIESWAYSHSLRGTPSADNLLTLVHFNVFKAMGWNALILGLGMNWLEENALSPFNTLGPVRVNATADHLPVSLQPTMLQQIVPHHPWLDLLPSPRLRDNLLLAGDALDESKLCTDILGFSGHSTEGSGLVVWGESWDPNGWEATEDFAKNWNWALTACDDIQSSTNDWRQKRGLKPLQFGHSFGVVPCRKLLCNLEEI
ncbi:hypothetical protein N7520_005498 [Penicillium odoratum]|uniref:uncharacterized protein n=1 Tax=Penicillium odoratum TaxID=1167516 RepID=UPI002547242E|nr:uncharacterized protein N7520_005498 [Penicillium odoratum]KAJ5765939.1 hypothetical protein N7520_005498 [Penicillium odoratum]